MHPTPKSIVLVDDEKPYADLLARMLALNLECPVACYHLPTDALAALGEANPAVIVTDYHMPRMDGLEFIARASTLAPQAAFVIISGHNLSAQQDRMARCKALKGHLAKPFGWRVLADEILRAWPDECGAPPRRRESKSV